MKNTVAKKLGLLAASGLLACTCAVAAGCAAQSEAPSTAVAGTETTPRLMPAQHQKYVDRPAYKCYTCHGSFEKGNPAVASAVALPFGHYVNNDPETRELDPLRNDCRSCHSVDPGKERDAAEFEAAEVETGQDKLDGE